MSFSFDEVDRRKAIADHYFDNYKKYAAMKDMGKASEFLWGTLENLAYALGLLDNKTLGGHGKVRSYLVELATSLRDKEIIEEIVAAEQIHANFYHNFMDEDVFDFERDKAEKLAQKLERILSTRVREIQKSKRQPL